MWVTVLFFGLPTRAWSPPRDLWPAYGLPPLDDDGGFTYAAVADDAPYRKLPLAA